MRGRAQPYRLTVAVVVAFALPSLALAQARGVVRGTVRDTADGSPIRSVLVNVRATGIATVTRSGGGYRVAGVPAGQQVLIFRIIGFAPEARAVQVVDDSVTTVNVALTLRPIQLTEIAVEAVSRASERIVEAPAAVSVVDPSVLRAVAPSGQLPLALRTLPGVDVVQGGTNDFNVNARGMNSVFARRVLVLQDGRDLAVPLIASPFEWGAMAVPLDESARVEFVRGPGSALYGANAYSGVLDIRTPAAREIQGTRLVFSGGAHATLQADVRHAGVLAGGRLGYRVNLGWRRSDLLSRSRTSVDSLDLAREYANAGPGPFAKSREVRPLQGQTLGPGNVAQGVADPSRSWHGAARLDWYARGGSVATVEAGTARLENEVYVAGPARFQRLRADRPWARLNFSAHRFNLMAYYSGDNTPVSYYNLGSGGRFIQRDAVYHVEGQFNRSLFSDRVRMIAGGSWRATRINTDTTYLSAADDDRTDVAGSIFGQIGFRASSAVRVVAATRWDQGTLYDGRFSPKIALVVTPTPRHALRATVNQAFRAPTALERFTRGAAGPPLTNPRVQETNLDAYFASVQSAVAGGSLPAAVVAGLDVAPLPWRFDSLTLSQSRGNRHLKVERLTAIELGWKGQIGANGYVTVDLFRNDMRDFITLPLPGVNLDYAPFELDSGRTIGVMATLDSLDARLAAQGRPASDPLRASIPGLRTGYQNLSGSASPRLVTTPEGRRALVISFTNASRVIAQGVEIGGSFPLTPLLRVDGSVTYFHSEVREVKLGDRLVSNTPRWKGTLGFRYDDQRLDLSATWRYVEGYDWAAGNFVGPVGASSTLDAACGYRISRRLRGHALVTNLLDQRRYQFFGGAVIGRQALFGMTADF